MTHKKSPLSFPDDRRRFMGQVLGTAGAFALCGMDPLMRLAQATGNYPPTCGNIAGNYAGAKDRYFIFCYFDGAWDVLLSLDPRDPQKFNATNMSVTKIQPAYELTESSKNDQTPYVVTDNKGQKQLLGPFMGDLAAHFDKMSIVRGMNMDTLTHEVGRRRFITGKQPAGLQARGSAAATWLTAMVEQQHDSGLIIPNLALNVESYNVDFPPTASAMKVVSVNDLQRAFQSDATNITTNMQAAIDGLHNTYLDCDHIKASDAMVAASLAKKAKQQIIDSNLYSHFDFGAKNDTMAALRSHYGIAYSSNPVTMANRLKSLGGRAATAAVALMKGVSRVVSFSAVSGGLDTHFDNWASDQGKRQQEGFDMITRLVEHLSCTEYKNSGTSWLDHTTIVCFSEFSRTPLLNAQEGRDHHLANSCMLLGAGIKGGNIVGASTDIGMMPSWTNLNTGQTQVNPPGTDQEKKEVAVMKPEHVIRALLTDVGVTEDKADLRVEPLNAILKNPKV